METVLRVTILYVFLVAGLRVMGKREFSQMSSTDLVMLLIVSELVQQALVGEDFSATNAVIAVSTLFFLAFLNSTLEHHSRRFSGLVTGRPAVVVYDGRFVPRTMNLERIAPDDVYSEMHKAGLAELSEVRWALLEPDGRLSFVPFRPDARPIRREQETQSG
jgi:uncharacterized membrane protein YcaP (DUF421 family)